MNFIYQDFVQMALILQKHSEEIRMLKKNTFKRNKQMKEKAYQFVQERNFDGLVGWMRGLVKKETVVA
jgi:hypothetical protein